uniref:Uncharacterized protein n=1 Tax=Rhizophora mucronata TaxID=61149 RepID=A0A2P2R3K1_RHIMU
MDFQNNIRRKSSLRRKRRSRSVKVRRASVEGGRR